MQRMARRVVTRYLIANDMVRGTWANITGYKNALKRMSKAAEDLSELFAVPGLKTVARDLQNIADVVQDLDDAGDWFRNYVEGSELPSNVDRAIKTYLGAKDPPSLDEILEMLDQSPFVKVLKKSHKVHRRPVERAVNALYNWVENPNDVSTRDEARVEQNRLKQLDMSDVERAYRRLAEIDPESLRNFLQAKKWVKGLAEADTVDQLKPLLEVWEDEVISIGSEEYLGEFPSDEESPWKGLVYLDGILKDLHRDFDRLTNLILPD